MATHKLSGMAREVAEKYKETLVTLTFNNKIVINTLTEIAKEDTKYASVIVATIEERLRKVTADQMLPIMYLIDSICKNHGSPYKELFQHGLVSNFAFIFQQVSEKAVTPKEKQLATQVRALLYKLRLTWGGSYQVFTDAKLHQLDLRIKKIDPAWPVAQSNPARQPLPVERSSSGTKIHVNPNFVGKPVEKAVPIEDETEIMRAELLKKEAELIKLKKMQLDMQIQQMKDNLLQQKPPAERDSTVGSSSSGTTESAKSSSSSSKKVLLVAARSYSIMMNIEFGMFISDNCFDIRFIINNSKVDTA